MPAVCRWAVKVDNWHPEQDEWNFLLRLLSSEVRAEVQRYKFEADQRRCLVSKLLQRKCVRDVCSVPVSEINIQRTKGGKPFCANHCNPVAAPNFNFNVSHEVAHTLLLSIANGFSANCLTNDKVLDAGRLCCLGSRANVYLWHRCRSPSRSEVSQDSNPSCVVSCV